MAAWPPRAPPRAGWRAPHPRGPTCPRPSCRPRSRPTPESRRPRAPHRAPATPEPAPAPARSGWPVRVRVRHCRGRSALSDPTPVMTLRLRPLAGALALAFAAPCAFAQPAAAPTAPASATPTDPSLPPATSAPTVFDLQRVTITATQRGPLSTRSVLTSVDRAGGDAVQANAADGNWSLFARLPGLSLTPFNQGTTTGKVAMRGFNGEGEVNAVKLLIDGVPSNSNDGNMPYLDLLPPLGLAAIQAVRGTNDARFGLHGIAGNLELVTREGGNANEARLATGAWGLADAQVAIDREAEGLTTNLAFGLRSSDGWREHAASDRRALSARWTWRPEGADWRATIAVRALQHEAEEPGYLTDAQL